MFQAPKPEFSEEPSEIGTCSWPIKELGDLVKEVAFPKKTVGGILRLSCNLLGGPVPSVGAPTVVQQAAGSVAGPASQSWQCVGTSLAFQKVDQQTLVGSGTPPAMAAGFPVDGLSVPGLEVPGSGSHAESQGLHSKLQARKEVEEDVEFHDSVSQIGMPGNYRGPLGHKPRSNMTVASSCTGLQQPQTSVNSSALQAKFTVDVRVLEWPPHSVEEYLNAGQIPQGLGLDGQASINALALGFDMASNQYDAASQLYYQAVWTKYLIWFQ